MNPAANKIRLFLAGGMLACLMAQAQEHVPEYVFSAGGNGMNTVRCLAPWKEGTVFVAGECAFPLQWGSEVHELPYSHGGFVAMMDGNGNKRWLVKLGSPSFFSLNAITVTRDEKLLVGGTILDTLFYPGGFLEAVPPMSSFLLEFDTLGNMIDERTLFPGQQGYLHSLIQLPGQRMLAYGEFQGNFPVKGAGKKDIFMACTSHDGTIEWIRSMGGRKNDRPAAMVFNGKNIFIGGNFSHRLHIEDTTLVSAGKEDYFIACYDTCGKLLSVLHQGGKGSDVLSDLVADTFGNVWCTGFYEMQPGTGNGSRDLFMMGFDSTGKPCESIHMEGLNDESGLYLSPEQPGTLYFLFSSEGHVPGIHRDDKAGQLKSIFLGKYSPKDSVEWIKSLGFLPGAGLHVMKAGMNGDIFIGGNFSDSAIIENSRLMSGGEKDLLVARYYDPCRRITLYLGPDRYLCPGETDTLRVEGEWISYNWNDGTGNESYFPVGTGGYYSLEVISQHGCRYTDTLNVNESKLSVGAEVNPEQIPPGGNGSILLNASGNFPPFSYHSSITGYGPLYGNLKEGWYTITVTDSVGCSSEILAEVTSEVVYGLGLEVDPNPYAILTNVTYTIPEKAQVELLLYDQSGILQKRIFQGERLPGTYHIELGSAGFVPGIYILQLNTGKQTVSRKILITRGN